MPIFFINTAIPSLFKMLNQTVAQRIGMNYEVLTNTQSFLTRRQVSPLYTCFFFLWLSFEDLFSSYLDGTNWRKEAWDLICFQQTGLYGLHTLPGRTKKVRCVINLLVTCFQSLETGVGWCEAVGSWKVRKRWQAKNSKEILCNKYIFIFF